MAMKSGNKLTERQRRNLRFSEKYFDLLDAMRELGDTPPDSCQEECRGQDEGQDGVPCDDTFGDHPENPPPEQKSREPTACRCGHSIGNILSACLRRVRLLYNKVKQLLNVKL